MARMGRIERGEQRVLRQHAGAGQRIEQGRLAGIGVADERHGRIRHPRPRFPMQRARAAHLLELGANALDPVADDAPVGLDLGLAGTAQEAEAAALTLKVGPGAHEPALLIDEMGKLDLQASFPRARARAEDLENQSGAVEYLGTPRGLQIALLHRGERVIDDHELRHPRRGSGPRARRPCLSRKASPAAGVGKGTRPLAHTSRSIARARPRASSRRASGERGGAECRSPFPAARD